MPRLRFLPNRLLATLAGTLAVSGSLLVFPAGIPVLLAAWLMVHSTQVYRGESGGLPLVVAALVPFVKGSVLIPGLLGFAALALVIGVLRTVRRLRFGWRGELALLTLLWLAWGALLLDWQRSFRASPSRFSVPAGPVVCLGDSLTANGYPRELAGLLTVPVLDFGVDGSTSLEGLRRLPAIVANRPQVVVVALGGHDYLRGRSRSATRANLEGLVAGCRAAGAEVILVEIPRGFVFDPYRGLEREIARKHDLELISDTTIRRWVLFSPMAPPGRWLGTAWHLSDDGLHPNARGNRILARRVARALERRFGPEILASEKGER